jgi:hypothetical protein
MEGVDVAENDAELAHLAETTKVSGYPRASDLT